MGLADFFAVTRRARDLLEPAAELSDRRRFFVALFCAKAPAIPMLETRANDSRIDGVVVVFNAFLPIMQCQDNYLLNRGASART